MGHWFIHLWKLREIDFTLFKKKRINFTVWLPFTSSLFGNSKNSMSLCASSWSVPTIYPLCLSTYFITLTSLFISVSSLTYSSFDYHILAMLHLIATKIPSYPTQLDLIQPTWWTNILRDQNLNVPLTVGNILYYRKDEWQN